MIKILYYIMFFPFILIGKALMGIIKIVSGIYILDWIFGKK